MAKSPPPEPRKRFRKFEASVHVDGFCHKCNCHMKVTYGIYITQLRCENCNGYIGVHYSRVLKAAPHQHEPAPSHLRVGDGWHDVSNLPDLPT